MWTPQQRNLFQYFDGEKAVWGDPLAIQRVLYQELGSPDEVLADAQSADPLKSLPAVGRLMDAARTAFGMMTYDRAAGTGATEEHCRMALEALWAFLEAKKKQPASSPTSPQPTASSRARSAMPITSG